MSSEALKPGHNVNCEGNRWIESLFSKYLHTLIGIYCTRVRSTSRKESTIHEKLRKTMRLYQSDLSHSFLSQPIDDRSTGTVSKDQ